MRLKQNDSNPFNPATTIPFSVPEAGPVRLEVFVPKNFKTSIEP